MPRNWNNPNLIFWAQEVFKHLDGLLVGLNRQDPALRCGLFCGALPQLSSQLASGGRVVGPIESKWMPLPDSILKSSWPARLLEAVANDVFFGQRKAKLLKGLNSSEGNGCIAALPRPCQSQGP